MKAILGHLRQLCLIGLGALLIVHGSLSPRVAFAQVESPLWYEIDASGEVQLHFYFFWSESCPHCLAAHPFVEALPLQYPWLLVHDLELSQSADHVEQYVQLAAATGAEAQYVPAFIYCGKMLTGYDQAATTGSQIEADLQACHKQVQAYVQTLNVTATGADPTEPGTQVASDDSTNGKERSTHEQIIAPSATQPAPDDLPRVVAPIIEKQGTVSLPFFGTLALDQLSLPVMTVVLAGLDAFNPCAFFVLMFLLSLMGHAKSRQRMLLIGGVFVLCSGLVYFVFMAAWLNLFLVVGALRWITVAAGVIALLLALINIKDYFWFKQGPSLTIPDRVKPKLYQRMRALLTAESLPTMLVGTTVLAVAANSYELLCTSGFPMIYTRMLTLNTLATPLYYLYLAAYNLIYIIPLLLIVLFFAIKFGSRKLREEEGRALKLLSGLMMLMLGCLLIIAPELLGQVWIALGLLLTAILLTAVVLFFGRHKFADSRS